MNKTEPLSVHVRIATKNDIDNIIDIEAQSYSEPWNEKSLARILKMKTVTVYVAMHRELGVVGFIIAEISKQELKIANVAVHPHYHRRKVASKMIAHLTTELASLRRPKITADVREHSVTVQLLLRSCRFRATGVLHKSFVDNEEDAIHMEYRATWPKEVIKKDTKGPFMEDLVTV